MAKIISVFSFLFFSLFATSQSVDFTFQSSNGLLCNSSTIQFTQNCTGNPIGFLWNLGNGLKSTTPNTSTSYIYPGNYLVKLIAIYPQGRQIEMSKTIVIAPDIVPKLSADRNYICQPGVINFTATSNGNIASYEWDFGDTTGINTTQPNINSHNFANYGPHTVTVKATDASGCFGSSTIKVDIKKLPIKATATPSSGCIPAIANFNANVTLPLNSTVTNYLWDFGDGTPSSSTPSGSTNYSYNAVGNYSPTLIVTTSEGCTNSINFPTLAYGTPPLNTIAYTAKSVVCGSETTSFIGKATNANTYLWWSREDNLYISAIDTIAHYKYTTLGTKTVFVTPFYNGCRGTAASFKIDVVGVIAKYSFSNTCSDKKTFSFTNLSLGNQTSIVWDFGDGSPADLSNNPTHTFPASGQFKTVLTITDAVTGCTDTFSRVIYTGTPSLVNADASICKNSNTTFSISGNYTNAAATYTWKVVGRQISNRTTPSISLKADTLGNFNNFVVINNGTSFCNDTIVLDHPILVRGPNLSFTAPSTICFPDVVNVTNTSRPFVSADSVSLWYWNYGNSLSNDTIYQPPPIQYNAPRSFRIKLVGIDINGCKDSVSKVIAINPVPRLQVSPRVDTLCAGQSDSLFAFHTNNILWTPSVGLSCTSCDTVIAKPTATTQYMITASNSFNCSIQDSILVKVMPNFSAVPLVNSPYVCLHDQDTLDVGPKDKKVVWSPAIGLSNSNSYTPIVRPTQTTTYTATLTDSVGCFTRTANITVFVKSLPTVDAGINRILPYNSTFTIAPIYSNNVRSYLWTPSLLLNCSTCATPSGIATSTENYQIEVTSDSGCVAKDSITIAIECKESNLLMPKAFTPNNDNLNDFYYPITRGIKTVLRFSIYNREGQVLFEARDFIPNNKSFAWNGEFKGERQSPRAYVYVLEAVCDEGQRITKSGSFLLLR